MCIGFFVKKNPQPNKNRHTWSDSTWHHGALQAKPEMIWKDQKPVQPLLFAHGKSVSRQKLGLNDMVGLSLQSSFVWIRPINDTLIKNTPLGEHQPDVNCSQLCKLSLLAI